MAFGTARKPAFSNSLTLQPSNLEGDLVPPGGVARAALDDFHRAEAEGEQHGLLQPLVDGPVAVRAALGHPHLAAIEQVERGFDGVAHFAPGGRVNAVAIVEGGVDGLRQGGEIMVRHRNSLNFGVYREHALEHDPERIEAFSVAVGRSDEGVCHGNGLRRFDRSTRMFEGASGSDERLPVCGRKVMTWQE